MAMEPTRGLIAPTKIIASDRRMTMHMMGLWQGLRPGPAACARFDEFAAAMPEDFWVDCCVVETTADGGCEIQRIGENLAYRSGIAERVAKLSELPEESFLAVALRDYEVALARRAPILDEGEARDAMGRTVLFRSIILPLAEDDGKVTQLLVGARCRVRAEDA